MVHSNAERRDVIDLELRVRAAWETGCNCQLCFLIEKVENYQLSREGMRRLLGVWIDENGPVHVGTKWWSKNKTQLWL